MTLITLDYTDCRRRVDKLPPRLLDVLRLLAAGQSKKQIAGELALSENTVRIYMERLYSVLGVHNSVMAARVAVAAGVV